MLLVLIAAAALGSDMHLPVTLTQSRDTRMRSLQMRRHRVENDGLLSKFRLSKLGVSHIENVDLLGRHNAALIRIQYTIRPCHGKTSERALQGKIFCEVANHSLLACRSS